MPQRSPNSTQHNRQRILIWIVMAVVIFGTQYFRTRREEPQPEPNAPTSERQIAEPAGSRGARPVGEKPRSQPVPTTTSPNSSPAAPTAKVVVLRDVSLRDENGKTIYHGDIDLKPTLDRIAAGKHLRFSHDGSTFQNRERRIPQKAPGYYREWVVPTPGEDGPGPQRIVTGEEGDVWYTRDHYRTFERIPYRMPAEASSKQP